MQPLTDTQKEIVTDYVLDLVGLIEQGELTFNQGTITFKTDNSLQTISGLVVKNADTTFGVIKDGCFYEGIECDFNEAGVILEMIGEPTKIEDLI